MGRWNLVSCYLVELKGRYGIALESIYDRDFAESLGITYAYQLENDRSLHDYRTSDQLDIDEYNAQPLEVDANAFAAVVMAEFFGISPQFLNMPESIRQLIYVRKRQIQKELKDG